MKICGEYVLYIGFEKRKKIIFSRDSFGKDGIFVGLIEFLIMVFRYRY